MYKITLLQKSKFTSSEQIRHTSSKNSVFVSQNMAVYMFKQADTKPVTHFHSVKPFIWRK